MSVPEPVILCDPFYHSSNWFQEIIAGFRDAAAKDRNHSPIHIHSMGTIGQLRLEPGMSISIQPRLYHDFEVEPGTGNILIGEVSQCSDDNTDNRFNPPVGRFPKIEEDEPPYRLLCNEYF